MISHRNANKKKIVLYQDIEHEGLWFLKGSNPNKIENKLNILEKKYFYS